MFCRSLWLLLSKKWKPVFKSEKDYSWYLEGLIGASKLQHKNIYSLFCFNLAFISEGTWIGLYATNGTGLGFKEAVSCLAFGSIGIDCYAGWYRRLCLFLIAKVLEAKRSRLCIRYCQWHITMVCTNYYCF